MKITKIVWRQPGHSLKCMGCNEPAVNEVKLTGEYADWTLFLCEICSLSPEQELLNILRKG